MSVTEYLTVSGDLDGTYSDSCPSLDSSNLEGHQTVYSLSVHLSSMTAGVPNDAATKQSRAYSTVSPERKAMRLTLTMVTHATRDQNLCWAGDKFMVSILEGAVSEREESPLIWGAESPSMEPHHVCHIHRTAHPVPGVPFLGPAEPTLSQKHETLHKSYLVAFQLEVGYQLRLFEESGCHLVPAFPW